MSLDLESHLLTWLAEELDRDGTPVALRLLVLRMALLCRPEGQDLTQSIELSLSAFERSELLRIVRQLVRRNLVECVNEKSKPFSASEVQQLLANDKSDKTIWYLNLTKLGRQEIERMRRCRIEQENPSEEPSASTDTTSENPDTDDEKTVV